MRWLVILTDLIRRFRVVATLQLCVLWASAGTAPLNDNFADRIALAGTNVVVSASNLDATLELGEPVYLFESVANSVWWSWTAPINGRTEIRIPNRYSWTIAQAYTGSALESLTLVPDIDDLSIHYLHPDYTFVFEAIAGTEYSISVGSLPGLDGPFQVRLSLTPNPPNDAFTNTVQLSGTDISVAGSNVGATPETDEPRPIDFAAGNSVWWTWTAPASGGVTISTDGSDFDTIVSAYTGTSLSTLQWINTDDNSGEGSRSRIAFNATEGVLYHIAVTGFSDGMNPSTEGNIVLHLTLGVAVPVPPTDPAALPNEEFLKQGSVTGIAVQPDGKIIVAGKFSAINGVGRTNLARLNQDGSLDLTWNPAIDGSVEVIAPAANGVFIAGSFRSVNRTARDGLAKLNLTDGKVDSLWDPSPNGRISQLAIIGDHLFVGGTFSSIGAERRSALAKLETIGAGHADASWDPQPFPPAIEGLMVFEDQLIVAGAFTQIGGQARSRLAKLSSTSNGSADPIWNPNGLNQDRIYRINAISGTNLFSFAECCTTIRRVSLLGEGVVDTAWSFHAGENSQLAAGTDDNLYVASVAFSDIDDLPRVFKLNANGTNIVDPMWQVPNFRRNPSLNDTGQESHREKLVDMHALVVSGTKVFCGGNFQFANDLTAMGMTRLDAITGNVDRSFAAQVQSPGSVLALARQPDGKLVVGGDFAFAGNLTRQNLARLNLDGTVDADWFPDAEATVTSLGANETGIYVAGLFNSIGGLKRLNLARIPLTSGASADPTWDPKLHPGSGGISRPIQRLVLFNTNVYIGARDGPSGFSVGGVSGFARIDTTTGVADSGPFFPNEFRAVTAMALQPDGKLIIGGVFNIVGGVSRTNLARFNASAASELDLEWAPQYDRATMGFPKAMALDPEHLFVATESNVVFKYQLSGAGAVDLVLPSDERFKSFGPYSWAWFAGINSLAVVGQDLYVGGLFRPIGFPTVSAGGPGLSLLASLDTTSGETRAAWNTDDGTVFTLLESNGDLLVGGRFTQFGNLARVGLASLAAPPKLSLAYFGSGIALSWPASAGLLELYSTPDLNPPVTWAPENVTALLTNGQWNATVPVGSDRGRFYRLQSASPSAEPTSAGSR